MAMLRAYLVDATYDWLIDHGFTPYLLVDTEFEGVEVPWDYVEDDGKILLNLSPEAIVDYSCDDEYISFHSSFDGESMQVFVPLEAVSALYSKETGQGVYGRDYGYGMVVNEGDSEDDLNPDPVDKEASNASNKPDGSLRLV
ncbi:ClpXP protease specificity-enhancing factor SspB [Thiotrichales bacterium 19S11-10]|nr:ClpXP protease specificity-enhancing factor SspB [Thiotrichales bacterium 19S11-10]MCF6807114.1 ClpXP protease specificity-enhancing factor SspB [Thiotrichales bacterium 19S9-11]MCF6811083.1 ClpXP protease specificity-enhancing factor SspB [Thiotrichales bacterium 19S9-12]